MEEDKSIIESNEQEQSPEILLPELIVETLPTLINKLCIIKSEAQNAMQFGQLLTDGNAFGFNGGMAFTPDFVSKIYPINVDPSKNQVRAVIYLKN